MILTVLDQLTCVWMCVCVSQVVTIRTVHEKLLRLLPGGKQQALAHVFEPFSGLNPLHYNPYTEVYQQIGHKHSAVPDQIQIP